MRPSRDDQEIIRLSLAEIEAIGVWVKQRLTRHPTQKLCLIGGWAVYLYNPWLGSIDIDLVTGSDLRHSLSQYLVEERGYQRRDEDGIKFLEKRTERGEIIIDFVTTSDPWEFYGTGVNLGFGHLDIPDLTVAKKIGEAEVLIPTRSLLLIYKLKASWDRTKRCLEGKSTRQRWEEDKAIKDGADVLALIDPENGGTDLDLGFLGKAFSQYHFLKDHLVEICHDARIISEYGRMDEKTASEVCERLLMLIELI
ncbi:hypothetical protein [Methanocella arvoryzae]|uniref:hypothetical protein n=1 Tax=Methanocella arvoryzae TaxID=1175445 RepID=UPI00064E6CD8|nr:hypothetical protein [Methanocella arvoryzae]